ncbi:MAG: ABC transporter permease subunit [Bacteroidota bacterium]
MLHLLQLEWKKVQYLTIFRVLVGFYLLALPALLLLLKYFPEPPVDYFSKDVFFMFPSVWAYLGYIGNWLCFFFFGFLSVISVTNEFANRTLRQNIITGLSRTDFFVAKFSFILAISFFATVYYMLVGGLIGFFNTETIYLSKVLQEAQLFPRYFLMCFGYMTIGLLIGLLIRRTGISLFIYLAYAMIFEKIIRYGIHYRYLVEDKSIHFYPINALSDLMPFNSPFNEMAKEFAEKNGFEIFLSPSEAAITSLIYIALFLGLAYRILARRDL